MKQNVGAARHIVVVDGDRNARASLVEYLQKNGFSAAGAANTHALTRPGDQRRPDLVVLELMLSEEDGLARCAAIREELRIPVIAMSAKADDIDRILALEVGADDFIAKPFNPREVLARVRNVLRRFESTTNLATQFGERYSFAGWTLDTTSRSLFAPGGEPIPLAGGEFELLLALVTNANRVLTRDELLELTKGRGAQPFDRSIDVKISRLRQRLGDHSQSARIIKAIYGKGYVLAAPVAIED
jgi:two-component system, OmpR family, response regulator